uniref:Parasitoid killing factor 2 n=1 Tax=Spodoptera exigua TaxID=7107 RepID=A0A866W3E8_SPOEX|nr:parasitoid killing factor 2 [Spodoptera exigua]
MNTKAHLYLWLLLLLQSSIDCFKYDPSKYAIGLFEAYSPNGDGHSVPCMGTCYGTRKEVCRFGWDQEYEGKNCKLSDNVLTRHYTEYYQGTTKQCISNCKHFGGYYKPWCITEDSWWMCIKEIPRNVTRKLYSYQTTRLKAEQDA